MIQRIQSVFLILSSLILSSYFFGPVAGYTVGDVSYSQTLFNIEGVEAMACVGQEWMLATLILSMLMPVVCIFSYKDRKKQMKMVSLAKMFLAALLVATYYFVDMNASQIGSYQGLEYGWVVYSSVASMLLLILAGRAIRKDEALVKSLDRLR